MALDAPADARGGAAAGAPGGGPLLDIRGLETEFATDDGVVRAVDGVDIAPHWALAAGGAIFLAVLTINFIGDGLRDVLDPRKVM